MNRLVRRLAKIERHVIQPDALAPVRARLLARGQVAWRAIAGEPPTPEQTVLLAGDTPAQAAADERVYAHYLKRTEASLGFLVLRGGALYPDIGPVLRRLQDSWRNGASLQASADVGRAQQDPGYPRAQD